MEIAFQYWSNGPDTQFSGIYTGDEIHEFVARTEEYWAQGNSVANLFVGTREEAKSQFPEKF